MEHHPSTPHVPRDQVRRTVLGRGEASVGPTSVCGDWWASRVEGHLLLELHLEQTILKLSLKLAAPGITEVEETLLWALTDSNRRPLPCKGRNAARSYNAPNPNSL